ncbi:RecB family exonuclease [Streptomyces calidiresistens]|uniref:Recombinase RecB n=1 Tax=Streptomyces calidiresistens TaxID=1485586 RepID=A0A7W3XXQ1_9ACTN|nr:PD-(D/E)XK nuclease family protein [Streptomyces calidiresistens]MBB0231021.1 recombinase RecB [Streptomyces calidiresistens]
MPRSRPAPPQSLSPSRAADFMRCPLLYRFRVIDRLPERPSAAATRGTVVHAVLERVFDAPAGERDPRRARAMVVGEWEKLLAARPELADLFDEDPADATAPADAGTPGDAGPPTGPGADDGGRAAERRARLAEWLAGAEELVERWFTLEDPSRLEPAEREVFVETRLESGLRVRGVIDRVDVAPTGEIRVVDYKTGRAPRPEYSGEALFQMRFYALVLWRLRGVIPKRLQLVYLGSGEVRWHDPVEEELLAVERRLTALWEAIRRATETGDWRPRRGPLCSWCDHRERCPEFGGTPPPYPLLVQPALPGSDAPDTPARTSGTPDTPEEAGTSDTHDTSDTPDAPGGTGG